MSEEALPADDVLLEEIHKKVCKDIREKLEIEVSYDRTYIFILAISDIPSKNNLVKISCKKGLPIFGYLYDSQSDSYHVECQEYIPLGYIPVSFYNKMSGVANWRQKVPMPEIAIRRYLNQQQKQDLRAFKISYKDCRFHFMQIIDCW